METEEKSVITCEQKEDNAEIDLLRAKLSDAQRQNMELEEMMSAMSEMHTYSTQQSKNLEGVCVCVCVCKVGNWHESSTHLYSVLRACTVTAGPTLPWPRC